MAITDENSVLILGAGASAPFGLPLGGELMDRIAARLESEYDFFLNKMHGMRIGEREIWNSWQEVIEKYATRLDPDEDGITVNSSSNPTIEDERKRLPTAQLDLLISSVVLCSQQKKQVTDQSEIGEQLVQLINLLKNQTSETIDDFIAQNPSYAELTKMCIAVELMVSCYYLDTYKENNQPHGFEFWMNKFDSREYIYIKPEMVFKITESKKFKGGDWRYVLSDPIRNWVHLLINIIRHKFSDKLPDPDNRVKIITFNYDQILEKALHKQFLNTERFKSHHTKNGDEVSYEDYIEIVHVHGKCGEITELADDENVNTRGRHNFTIQCVEWAKGIHVVNENEDEIPQSIKKDRDKAKEWIQNSKQIYACGFAFAGPNCEQLGLELSVHTAREIIYCNWDGNQGLEHFVKRELERKENYLSTEDRIKRQRDFTYMRLLKPRTSVFAPPASSEKPLEIVDFIRAGYLGQMPG